jgi:hypothetical protein
LTKFVLNATIISTLVVGITTLNGWVISIPTSYLQISAIIIELTLLVKLN